MARPPSPSVRTTVYRLVGVQDTSAAIRHKYLDGEDFELADVTVNGRAAVLITGSMVRDVAPWAERVERLTGVAVQVGNTTGAGVLLVPDEDDDNVTWALTWGMGFQLLDQAFVDPGFGQRVAVRTADPERLRSLTRSTMDHRARTDRSSIPAGEQLRGFGIGDFGEIVSRVVGPATIPGLTADGGVIRIRGADSISVPIGRTPSTLKADLQAIAAVLTNAPVPELAVLEQLVPVKARALIASLDDVLSDALLDPSHLRLALGWPHERIDESGTATSYKLYGAGRGQTGPFDDVPTLEHLRAVIEAKDGDDPLGAATTLKIQLFRDTDADEPMSGAIPVRKWLAFETDLDGQRYCLHDGRWYQMDEQYAERLHAHVEEIFARNCGIVLPTWTTQHSDERAYNIAAAADLGAIALDRDLIRTSMHPRGIEPCDILTSDGTPIHVKHLESSRATSHLIAQALVATDAFLHDGEAREALREKVRSAGGKRDWYSNRPDRVVLGLARSTAPTASDLFTFSQVTLARLDTILGAAGVKVYIVSIQRT